MDVNRVVEKMGFFSKLVFDLFGSMLMNFGKFNCITMMLHSFEAHSLNP